MPPRHRTRTITDTLVYALTQARPPEDAPDVRAQMRQWEIDVFAVGQALALHDPRLDPVRFQAKCQGPKEAS